MKIGLGIELRGRIHSQRKNQLGAECPEEVEADRLGLKWTNCKLLRLCRLFVQGDSLVGHSDSTNTDRMGSFFSEQR